MLAKQLGRLSRTVAAVDLDQPITVIYAGKKLFAGTPARTIEVLCRTLVGRGGPKLMFDA